MYSTLTSNEDDKVANGAALKVGIIDRLQKQVGFFSEQQMDRMLVNNSAVQGSGDLLRKTRRDAIGEKEEDSVIKRTNSTKFRRPDGDRREEGMILSRTKSFKTAVDGGHARA